MFRRLLDRLAGRSADNAAPVAPVPAPDRPFIVIGDIHGRLDLLQRLLDRIDAMHPDWPVVLVGDYIDRGDHSAEVLTLLNCQIQAAGSRLTCLIGNHEDMMLRFLDDPVKHGPLWLRNGGLQTLASFGVGGVGISTNADDLTRARDALAIKAGDRLIGWLGSLPLNWQSGNVVVVHAGADPALPMDQQKRSSLIWGHRDFLQKPRTDDLVIVHGHNIVGEACCANGRIAIDTGAYATGRLTAAKISPDGVVFISA